MSNGTHSLAVKKPVKLFYFVSILSTLAFFVTAFFWTNGTLFNWLVMENTPGVEITDFYRHVYFASDLKTVYYQVTDACFPPFFYLIFHFIWRINPMVADINTWFVSGYTLAYEPLIYIGYLMIVLGLLIFCISRITKTDIKETMILAFVILFSLSSFGGAIERGNSVILVVDFICLGLLYRNSDVKWKKRFAFLNTAFAAAFKIYPAIFGLLEIKEKKWKNTAELLLYGVLIAFVPFIFTGGMDGFTMYLAILFKNAEIKSMRWTSLESIIRWFVVEITGNDVEFLVKGLFIILVVALVALFFLSKSKWREIFFLTMIVAYGYDNSYRYYAFYLVVPFLLFYAEKRNSDSRKIGDYFEWIMWALIFSIPSWAIPFYNCDIALLKFLFDPENILCGSVYILMIYEMYKEISEIIKRRKSLS